MEVERALFEEHETGLKSRFLTLHEVMMLHTPVQWVAICTFHVGL